ncbi:MAG: hypothetical protein MI924_24085 [Chloroflexales bacterium]|nr:hypothetical protein [Chloroflexales bacterium]
MTILDNLTIRPFGDDDAAAVDRMLRDRWGHDPTMLAVYRIHRAWPSHMPFIRQTLLATWKETVCGAGTIFESALHPQLPMLAINVASEWQRRGIGAALYTALAARGDGRPLLVKATRRDPAGQAFLYRRNFRPRISTLIGVLDPRQPAVQQWMHQLPYDVPGYTFRPLDDPERPTSLITAARVHAAVYRRFHAWNPPIAESDEQALDHYCGPSVLNGSHLCVYTGTTLIGAANLFRDPARPDAAEGYLVHIGVVQKHQADADELTAALIRRSLEWATHHGLNVRFEADDTYQPHRAIFETAPAHEVDREFVLMTNE